MEYVPSCGLCVDVPLTPLVLIGGVSGGAHRWGFRRWLQLVRVILDQPTDGLLVGVMLGGEA